MFAVGGCRYVYKAVVLSKLLYASRRGFTSAAGKQRLEALLTIPRSLN